METRKYVRIKQASESEFWYADKIGEIFRVVEVDDFSYRVNFPGPDVHLPVSREDGEVIVTEKRRAERDDQILITNAKHGLYKNGDEFIVVEENPYGDWLSVRKPSDSPWFGRWAITQGEYEVIVNSEVENEEADEMENVNQTAIDSASTVFEKVGNKYIGSKSRFGDILIGAPYSEAFVKAYASERKDVLVIPKTIEYTAFLRSDEMKEVAKKSEYPNSENDDYPYGITDEDIQEAIKEARRDRAQALRDEIVEQAKADVRNLVIHGLSHYNIDCSKGNETYRVMHYNVEFIADSKERKVTALVARRHDKKPRHVGRAKAAPDDCFNVHIGKAIALRRALGLEVPEEYLNAPQPTEVRVGDVVYYSRLFPHLTVSERLATKRDGFVSVQTASRYVGDGLTKIIDDSREEVGE